MAFRKVLLAKTHPSPQDSAWPLHGTRHFRAGLISDAPLGLPFSKRHGARCGFPGRSPDFEGNFGRIIPEGLVEFTRAYYLRRRVERGLAPAWQAEPGP